MPKYVAEYIFFKQYLLINLWLTSAFFIDFFTKVYHRNLCKMSKILNIYWNSVKKNVIFSKNTLIENQILEN